MWMPVAILALVLAGIAGVAVVTVAWALRRERIGYAEAAVLHRDMRRALTATITVLVEDLRVQQAATGELVAAHRYLLGRVQHLAEARAAVMRRLTDHRRGQGHVDWAAWDHDTARWPTDTGRDRLGDEFDRIVADFYPEEGSSDGR